MANDLPAKSVPSKVFKIRRTTDKLFSNGGSSPDFNSKGKSWTTLSGLKNHLNLALGRYGRPHVYQNCEVILVELTPKIVEITPIDKILEEGRQKKIKKQQQREEKAAEERRKLELAELARLQEKYKTT